jgi:glycosyltransferase involved in cell wall biosynthesis
VKFSVVIVNYNTAGFLRKLLESVFSQKPSPSEVLVVDNGSEDGSPEIAESMGARVLRLGENRGFCEGANVGFASTSTDRVFFLNSDLI